MLWLVEPFQASVDILSSGPCDCIIGQKSCNCRNGLVVGAAANQS